jgi:hypothetical protein
VADGRPAERSGRLTGSRPRLGAVTLVEFQQVTLGVQVFLAHLVQLVGRVER